jgi:flagellar biosynthesis chaperone FliJ
MKIIKKIVIICLAAAVIFTVSFFIKVSAQSVPMTDQQIDQIRNNCVSVKNTLNQLHSSDALLRVNRGQIYESMSTKLMEQFNSRVSGNKFNNSSLVSATNSYESVLDTFRTDYIIYEKQLTIAISINCSKQPVTFYDAVDLARTERDQVHSDVVKLNQSIDQYKSVLDQFEKDYQAIQQGVKK